MKKQVDTNIVMFITSYPPRACGIATYSEDLANALARRFGESFSIRICALEDGAVNHEYPTEVVDILDTSFIRDYERLAQKLNDDESVRAVCIQHEFGLFSGPFGENLLFLLYALRKPVIVTFHSVLPNPESRRKKVVRAIASWADQVTVMTEHSKRILYDQYGIPSEKITVIPHGTHVVRWKNKDIMKRQYGLQHKMVLSTFGLLSPNKSIETALLALPAIRKEYPNVLYLILGRTHPGVIAHEGENYRLSLQCMISQLGLTESVMFVNRYLDLDELLGMLSATDIYLFTSKDPDQAVSGTFSYAMSCGCAVVSTRFPHATEMLQNDTGILIDFSNHEQLAEATMRLLADQNLRNEMSFRAFERTRITSWDNVAVPYAKLFAQAVSLEELTFSWPKISLRHLTRLTGERGIMQFAKISTPDPDSGYTLDDNSRALIAVCKHYLLMHDERSSDLIGVYLSFISSCQTMDGSFVNYVDVHGTHCEKNHYVNLEDSNGRAMWALGFLTSLDGQLSNTVVRHADEIFSRALENASGFSSPRAISFAIKGLHYYYRLKGDDEVLELVQKLADRLIDCYMNSMQDGWQWFEPYLTYANAVMPEALLRAYTLIGKPAYRRTALLTLDFLISRTFKDGMIRVISNRGWLHLNSSHEEYGEQPIDVAATIFTLDLFWRVFRNPEYLRKRNIAYEWFLGRNHLGLMIYNPASGGCYDGLEETNVNLNQGAESTICYLLVRLLMEQSRRTDSIRSSQLGKKDRPVRIHKSVN